MKQGKGLQSFARRMHWSQQQPSSNNTREDSTHGHHQRVNRGQIDYILCSQRWSSSIQSAKTKLGTDCGSDHELVIANFRLKLKKVEKTTRPFRYDLNQIPYDYTVLVRNRFKGLDLIECLMNYERRFMTLYRRRESRPSPRKRNAKKKNGCLRRTIQIAVKRKEVKRRGKKQRKNGNI